MERTIKFIWDYYGKPAGKTAEHHKIHLQEFVEQRQLKDCQTGFEIIDENRAITFMCLPEKEALNLKDILRPERAVVVNN